MDQYVQNLPESTQRQKLWRTNENRDERGEETNTPFGIQYLFRFEDFETDAFLDPRRDDTHSRVSRP
jgi:hypothetical protein